MNLLSSSIHQETSNFLDALFTNSVLPMITQPTRYGAQSATLIDNVITNKYMGQHYLEYYLTTSSTTSQYFLLLGTFNLNATQNIL